MWRCFVVSVSLFLSVLVSYPAQTYTRLNHEELREARHQGHVRSLRWVIRQIAPHYPGRILDVDLFLHDDRYIYVIRLLQDEGYVTKLAVDAYTAEVLQVRSRKKEKRKK